MNKILILRLIFFSSFSMAAVDTDDKWPRFDLDSTDLDSTDVGSADVIFVVGNVIEAKYLPEEIDPKCNSGEFVCLGPPPFKLDIEIEELVYGELTSQKISVFGTSHYGIGHFDVGGIDSYLFFLVTDGNKFLLPPYHFRLVSYALNGSTVLPMLDPSDLPFWLPCNVRKLNKNIDFDTSDGEILIPIEQLKQSDLDKAKGFSYISKYAVRILRGLELKDLSAYLSENRLTANNYRCILNSR